jgi:hypothetical protein
MRRYRNSNVSAVHKKERPKKIKLGGSHLALA